MKYIVLIYAMLLIGLDQLIKWIVDVYLKVIPTVGLIEGVVHLTYMENRGAAFSSFEGQYLFLILFTILLFPVGVGELAFPVATGNVFTNLLFT